MKEAEKIKLFQKKKQFLSKHHKTLFTFTIYQIPGEDLIPVVMSPASNYKKVTNCQTLEEGVLEIIKAGENTQIFCQSKGMFSTLRLISCIVY